LLQQFEWENINLLAGEINKIKVINRMRKVFLIKLVRLLAFDLTEFFLNDTKTVNGVRLIDAFAVSKYSEIFDAKFAREYEKYYNQVEYVKWIFSTIESEIYRRS